MSGKKDENIFQGADTRGDVEKRECKWERKERRRKKNFLDWQRWNKNGNVGYCLSRGNSSSYHLSLCPKYSAADLVLSPPSSYFSAKSPSNSQFRNWHHTDGGWVKAQLKGKSGPFKLWHLYGCTVISALFYSLSCLCLVTWVNESTTFFKYSFRLQLYLFRNKEQIMVSLIMSSIWSRI